MNDLDKNHSEYLEAKSKIELLTQNMQQKNEEIHSLQTQLIGVKEKVVEINGSLENPEQMAKGLLSTSDFLTLKKELNEVETLANSLRDAIEAQKLANELLLAERTIENRRMTVIKSDLASSLSTQAANKIADVAESDLKALINTILANANLNQNRGAVLKELYFAIGKNLCDKVVSWEEFGDSGTAIFKAREELDNLITAL